MAPVKGVSAFVSSDCVLCGNAKWLEESGIELSNSVADTIKQLRRQGKAIIITAKNNQVIGITAMSDTLRENAAEMLQELKNIHTSAVLLTGDHAQTANYFAEQVGINDIHAELLPEQKVVEIRKFQEQGKSICMIGDGINDAPALKTANVGDRYDKKTIVYRKNNSIGRVC